MDAHLFDIIPILSTRYITLTPINTIIETTITFSLDNFINKLDFGLYLRKIFLCARNTSLTRCLITYMRCIVKLILQWNYGIPCGKKYDIEEVRSKKYAVSDYFIFKIADNKSIVHQTDNKHRIVLEVIF